MSVFVCFLEKQSIVAYVSDLSPSSSSTEYGNCNKVLRVCVCVVLMFSNKITQTLLLLNYIVISKSAGAQLDLLILDTIYKVIHIIRVHRSLICLCLL